MNRTNRRAFLQTSAGALAAGLSPAAVATLKVGLTLDHPAAGTDTALVAAQPVASNEGRKPLRLGLIIGVGEDPDASMAKVHDLRLPTCQAFVDDFQPGLAERLRHALDKHGIEATSLVVGGPGKEVWDFYQGPLTIGLVPRETRAARVAHIKKASDFAKRCGIPAVQTHCGFIPENPNDEAKDGLWPTNPKELGEEVPIGKGKVDFPRIIARLKELNYRGAVTIEREISGVQQVEDVRAAKAYLEKLIG